MKKEFLVICILNQKQRQAIQNQQELLMKNVDHYGKTKLLKIGDYNISEEGDIITIPHYLTFAIGKREITL